MRRTPRPLRRPGRFHLAGISLDGYRAGFGPPSAIRTYESLRSCSQLLNVTLNTMDKLSIAAINGFAIQSGLSLALCCDFRLASSNAKLGSATLLRQPQAATMRGHGPAVTATPYADAPGASGTQS